MSDSQSSYPKANFNDLLAEWIDSVTASSDYKRREDGTFDWIVWITWGGEDFNKFIHSRLSPTTANEGVN